VPLILLFIDYSINVIPFVRRHCLLAFIAGSLYMLVNFTATKVTGKPVYSTMDWDSVPGTVTPLLMCIFSPIMFLLFDFLNTLKLRLCGYHEIVKLSRKWRVSS